MYAECSVGLRSLVPFKFIKHSQIMIYKYSRKYNYFVTAIGGPGAASQQNQQTKPAKEERRRLRVCSRMLLALASSAVVLPSSGAIAAAVATRLVVPKL